MGITFGTDGWRGIVADDFTFENIRRVARAIARFLYWQGRKDLDIYKPKKGATYQCPYRHPREGIVVGYDTRFMSRTFAEVAAGEFIKAGIPVYLSSGPSSSPSISTSVDDLKACGAVIITASHNSPEYNGIKFKPEYGGSGTPEVTHAIEKRINGAEEFTLPEAEGEAAIKEFSPHERYTERVVSLIDLERIASSRFKIISDPIYGASRGLLEQALGGIGTYVEEIRGEINPIFGGYNPEPIGKNLAPLVERILRNKADIGFAYDGDGDRLGAVDSRGRFMNSHEVFALILWHLVENRKWSGGVARTFSTSHIIDVMAGRYGLPLYETPIGFKYIAHLMLEKDILLGGEESGGIGVKNHIPEKDAILISLLLLEAMAYKGEGIGSLLEQLMRDHGFFYFHRTDIRITNNDEKESIISRLLNSPPARFIDGKIEDIRTLDGIKYILPGNNWILFRPSGTEPVLRIYVEARSHELAQKILREGEELVQNRQYSPS
ncbi:MAG: phosphoglucomutase/phosphomannomutase family protein [Candidatus Eremiobacteraeota bacterium]|nr:phosphoglucomutase/phosphomannomutase family protein [Candidatus Eremiobacteraeota bacterium]